MNPRWYIYPLLVLGSVLVGIAADNWRTGVGAGAIATFVAAYVELCLVPWA
jgi:hypothetical protein